MKKLIFTLAVAFSTCTILAQPNLVHQFGNTNDGVKPQCPVTSDGTFLYGTAMDGGLNTNGIIYKVKPDGTGYTKLYDFDGAANGGHPYGALLVVGTTLYGMTYDGSTGFGVLYKIQNDGTAFTKLMDFGTLTAIGQYPVGALSTDGTFLYGMTQGGGGFGLIFKIKPDGTAYSIIHNFDGTHGSSPLGTLISDGTYLYGLTSRGGSTSNSLGTIFKIKPDGTAFSVLNEFIGTNGDNPMGDLLLESGTLYGYTYSGGVDNQGTIFKIQPDGTGFTQLYDFHGSAGGGRPGSGALVSDGLYLYGTTSSGGATNLGTIYKIKHDGTGFTDIFDFNVTLGAFPLTGLYSDGTRVYGTTNAGGINSGGVVYKLGVATGIAQVNAGNGISIYPNPTSGKFTIETTANLAASFQLEVYNVVGQKVYADTKPAARSSCEIDLSDVPAGVYFVKIYDGISSYTRKIVLQ